MNALSKKVAALQRSARKGLSFFLSGGWPERETFINILRYIDKNNLADFLEIGIPFSDPVADGPTIRKASEEALRAGVTFETVLSDLKNIKNEISVPLVIMSYMNPVYAFGVEKAFSEASASGISAFIIPDMPLEEISLVSAASKRSGVELILLAAPSSGKDRIRKIAALSRPFLYYVSSYGVTGARDTLPESLSLSLSLAREESKVPVYCGFGISTPEQAALAAKSSDGVIIGSALTNIISNNKENVFKEIGKFGISIRKEIEKEM